MGETSKVVLIHWHPIQYSNMACAIYRLSSARRPPAVISHPITKQANSLHPPRSLVAELLRYLIP